MADVALGLVGTVAVALHSARRIKEFIDTIQGAPRAVYDLSNDLAAFKDVLEILQTLLGSDEILQSRAQRQMLTVLEQPLHLCVGLLQKLDGMLKPLTKLSAKAKALK